MLYYKEREYLATVWDHLNFPSFRQMPFFEQASHPTFYPKSKKGAQGANSRIYGLFNNNEFLPRSIF